MYGFSGCNDSNTQTNVDASCFQKCQVTVGCYRFTMVRDRIMPYVTGAGFTCSGDASLARSVILKARMPRA